MLLDSVTGLRELYEDLKEFLSSPLQEISFSAITASDPTPYDELLVGLRVKKDSEVNRLVLTDDRWLFLSSSYELLEDFIKTILVEEDTSHNHWYSDPVSLIIEADNWRSVQGWM